MFVIIDPMFDTPLSRELAELLYNKLKSSRNGELGFYEILDIMDSLPPEYGLRRVSSGAIHIVRGRKDVEQAKDEKGRPFLKLI